MEQLIAQLWEWIRRNYFAKRDHAYFSAGAPDAWRPVVLNGRGYLDDTLFLDVSRQHKKSVSAGATLTIASGYQYLIADSFTVSGIVDIYGELVII